jgi:signal transduction histidine kinase
MATDRADERTGEAGPLSHWLAPALVDWLHAKGCTGLTLLDAGSCTQAACWRDAPTPGWVVSLGDALGTGVLLAFPRPEALDAAELADVAALFERLHAFPLVHDASDAVLVDHTEVRRLIHDLRNGLNTLLINASLLARAVGEDQPALARSAQYLESAGARCAEDLNRLSEMTARAEGRGGQSH